MKITIDSREQRPWHFPEWLAESEIGKLNTGDYALSGDPGFAIERKSMDDFLGTISTGWPRFCRELQRMSAASFPARIIIVEGTISSIFYKYGKYGEIEPPEHEHYKLEPAFILKRLAQLSYMSVVTLFMDNEAYAAAAALAILRERKKELKK